MGQRSSRQLLSVSPLSGSGGRGKPSKEDVTEIVKKLVFSELTKEGQEAFFRYLRGGMYPEDKDVCDVNLTAEGMNNKSRRYQFWLKCEKIELVNLFDDYISTDDELRLTEVQDCPKDGEELKDLLVRKKKDAENTQEFINDLKFRIKHELDTDFTDFKNILIEHHKK